MHLGAQLCLETLAAIIAADGHPETIAQEEIASSQLKVAPKIFKETCEIKWTSLEQVFNFVRGLSPYPAAWTTLHTPEGKEVTMKVFRTKKETMLQDIKEPVLQTDGKTYLRVAFTEGNLYLTEVQISGKKRMQIAEFMRGAHVEGWTL